LKRKIADTKHKHLKDFTPALATTALWNKILLKTHTLTNLRNLINKLLERDHYGTTIHSK
jgi:hypothetical protein